MKSPAEIDASEITEIEITFRDLMFTVPASVDNLPFDALEAFESAKAFESMRHILGPKQFAAFRAQKPTIGEAGELMEQWSQLVGLESLGE